MIFLVLWIHLFVVGKINIALRSMHNTSACSANKKCYWDFGSSYVNGGPPCPKCSAGAANPAYAQSCNDTVATQPHFRSLPSNTPAYYLLPRSVYRDSLIISSRTGLIRRSWLSWDAAALIRCVVRLECTQHASPLDLVKPVTLHLNFKALYIYHAKRVQL